VNWTPIYQTTASEPRNTTCLISYQRTSSSNSQKCPTSTSWFYYYFRKNIF